MDNQTKGCFTVLGWCFAIGFVLVGLFAANNDSSYDSSSSDAITWNDYHVSLDVRDDGVIHVTEEQVVTFDGDFSQGFAEIPDERIGSIDNVAVTVEEGVVPDTSDPSYFSSDLDSEPDGDMVTARRVPPAESLPSGTFSVEHTDGIYRINYGFDSTGSEYYAGYANDQRTIVLEYDVVGAIRVYPEAADPWQQIHWMAIAPDVSDIGDIEDATVSIHLPESAPVDDVVTAPEPESNDGQTIQWPIRYLSDGEGYDVQVAFPAMTSATEPDWQAAADQHDADVEHREDQKDLARLMLLAAGVLILVVGAVGIVYMWWRNVRGPEVGLVADLIAQPPDELPAGLVGALVDEEIQPRDLAAAIVDLDRRGVIEIAPSQQPGEAWMMTLEDPGASLAPWETTILSTVFGANMKAGSAAGFSRLGVLFSADRQRLQEAMDQDLVTRGMYSRLPEESRRAWSITMKGVLIGGFVIAAVGAFFLRSFSLFLLAPIIVGIAVWFFGRRLTPQVAQKTRQGAEVAAKWRAFQRYLEQQRTAMSGKEWENVSDTFAPWVLAFGIDNRWLMHMNTGGASIWGPHPTRPEGQGSTWTWGDDAARRSGRTSTWRTPVGGSRPGSSPSLPSLPGLGGSWDWSSWGDMQGGSNSAMHLLSSGSSGLMDMMGDALEAIGESSGSGGGGGRSSFGGGGGSSHSGGHSHSSSGGGSRGFR